MSAAPIIVVIMIIRIIMAASNARGGKLSGFRFGGARTQVSNAPFIAFVIWVFLAPSFFVAAAGALTGEWVALPFAIVLGAIVFPYLTTRYVLVPLGLARIAYYLNRIPSLTWRADPRGGANLSAAFAILRRGNEAQCEWLEKRIAKAKPLRAATVAASGLIAAKRGDLEGARVLLESVETLDAAICPKMAKRIAREWRIADALARDDHAALKRLLHLPGPWSRAGRLIRRIARHRIGQAEAGAFGLWFAWLVAPRRLRTFALTSRARKERFGALGPRRTPRLSMFMDPGQGKVEQAMRFEAGLLARAPEAINGGDLAELGRLWDGVLRDPALAAELGARAESLGAMQGAERVRAAIERALEEDLSTLIRGAEIKLAVLPKGEGVVLRAAQRVRSDLLAEMETACNAARRRTDERRELPGIDEWREWTSLRTMMERAGEIGGADVRRLAFPTTHSALCHLAVWLFNERKERAVGNAIFRWLRDEAMAVQNQAAVELQEKNVKCGAF